jgi:hypothetical protein
MSGEFRPGPGRGLKVGLGVIAREVDASHLARAGRRDAERERG